MDDEVEEKRRLDRARVLIKTPWRPTIQHTIHVHIGDETFAVDVIEESDSVFHDYLRGRRSFVGLSDEIFSDKSYYRDHNSQTHNQTHFGAIPSTSAANVVREDDMQLSTVPETQNEQRYLACRPDGGVEDHGTTLLSSGQPGCKYPVGNSSIPRTFGRQQRSTAAQQLFHQNGNIERREIDDMAEIHNVLKAETRDHSVTCDPTEAKDHSCNHGKLKNLEGDEDRGVKAARE